MPLAAGLDGKISILSEAEFPVLQGARESVKSISRLGRYGAHVRREFAEPWPSAAGGSNGLHIGLTDAGAVKRVW